MSLQLDTRALGLMLGGGATIVGGTIATYWGLKGTFISGGWKNARSHLVSAIGIGLVLIGWIIILISFGIDIKDTSGRWIAVVMGLLILISSAMILYNRVRGESNTKKWHSLLILVGAWITEATVLSGNNGTIHDLNSTKAAFNYIGMVAILMSLLWLEPLQSKQQEVHGPAYALLSGGWALLSVGYAIR